MQIKIEMIAILTFKEIKMEIITLKIILPTMDYDLSNHVSITTSVKNILIIIYTFILKFKKYSRLLLVSKMRKM